MENTSKDIKLKTVHLHCRTCLGTLSQGRHDFQQIPNTLIELLSYAGLEMPQKEVYPSSMCAKCYAIILNFEEFRNKLIRSTQCLEDLLDSTKTNVCLSSVEDSNVIEPIEVHIKKSETDPLQENEIYETNLIKLKMEDASSEEEEINKDDDQHSTHDPIEEKTANNLEIMHEIFDSTLSKTDTKKQSARFPCKYGCGRTFRRTHNADAHYRAKHREMTHDIEATECAESDNIKAEITQTAEHKKTCVICFKTFATLGGLRSHMSTHGDVRPFQCEQCNRGFNMKARLKRHIRETHEDNPPEISCKYGCGKTFTRHESAMNHYRVKHILPEKGIVPKTNTYICEDCGKTFKTMHNLKEHSYIHRPAEERPFQCEQCQKRFISKRPYEVHLLRHAGIKNFECKICGLKTTTHTELRNHMNHHTKAKQVNCPICSKTYTNPDNLRRHTLIVHQGVKNYKCRFCEEKFGKPDHLKHHEMRHTGERPHKCDRCSKSFIQLVALKAHLKTHNKLPKFTEAPKQDIGNMNEVPT